MACKGCNARKKNSWGMHGCSKSLQGVGVGGMHGCSKSLQGVGVGGMHGCSKSLQGGHAWVFQINLTTL